MSVPTPTQKSTVADWQANPGPQTEALSRNEDEILYGGARGGGKSEALLAWMVEPEYVQHPDYQGIVLRQTSEDLKDFVRRAKKFWQPLGAIAKYNPVEFHFPSGAVILTGHLNDADAVNKYLGHEYQKIGIEEITLIPDELSVIKIMGSCRHGGTGLKAQVFMTTNPQGIGNDWVQERYVDFGTPGVPKQDKTGRWRIFIKSLVKDNPYYANDPDYLAYLDSLPEHLRKAWRDGEWGVGEKQYFAREWIKKDLVIPTDMELVKPARWILRGIDWGYRDPLVCLWAAVLPPPRKRIYIFRELDLLETHDPEQAHRILETTQHMIDDQALFKKVHDTIADPSIFNNDRHTQSSIADCYEENGLCCSRGMNRRIPGWSRMRSAMTMLDPIDGKPCLQIMDNCPMLIKEIPRLLWDDRDPEDVDDRIGKDHASDTCRYLCASEYLAYLDKGPREPEKIPVTPEEKLNAHIQKGKGQKRRNQGPIRPGEHSW